MNIPAKTWSRFRRCEDPKRIVSIVFTDPKGSLNSVVFQELWMYFRRNDPQALSMYPDVKHMTTNMSRDDILRYQEYKDSYEELKSSFYTFIGLRHAELIIRSNDRDLQVIQIYKNGDLFMIARTPNNLSEDILDVFNTLSRQVGYHGRMFELEIYECRNPPFIPV